MKKILIFILTACMLLSLASCQKDGAQDGETSDAPTESNGSEGTDQKDNGIVFVEDGKAVCAIVAESKYDKQALSLAATLKEKLGVDIRIMRRATDEYKGYIYIGYDYNDLHADNSMLSYMGYALAAKDGNVYLCGYREDTLANAIEKLTAQIVPSQHVQKNASNRTVSASLPSIEAFFFSPAPKTANATLVTSPLSEYRIVISSEADTAIKELTAFLVEEIAEETHCILEVVTDATDAVDKEIIIGKTSRQNSAELTEGLAAEEYAVKSVGDTVHVAFGSYISYEDAISELKRLYKSGEKAEINIKEGSEDYGLYRRNDSHIRVMTANVLFYANVNVNGYYKLSGKARQEINVDCFLSYMPDFIGVQEVDTNNLNIIEAGLSEYYGLIASGENKEGYDHIFYRKDKYKLEESEWSKNPGSNGWYVMGRFSDLNDASEQFIVVNLHISPYSTEDRLIGANAINEKLKDLQESYPDIPLLVVGDYNSHIGTVEHQAMFADIGASMSAGREIAKDGANTAGIDHLYVSTELIEVERFRQPGYPAVISGSDHHFGIYDLSLKQ